MMRRIAVIGAGIAGLSCAARLEGGAHEIALFDKSHAPGGRAATRRRGGPAFDHGAPGLAARTAQEARWIAGLVAQGAAARWPEGDALMEGDAYTGLPGMREIAAPMLRASSPRYGAAVSALSRGSEGWTLGLEDGTRAGPFDAVALAIPAPQARALLGDRAAAFPALAGVEMSPCWTAMAGWEAPLPRACPTMAAGDAPLARIIADHAKPGRDRDRPAVVLQASAAWSAARLEEPAGQVGAALLSAFAAHLGAAPGPPAVLMVHRWRHARTAAPAGADCLWDGALGLGLCGDWCPGGGIPQARASGLALAGRIAGG